MKKSTTLKALVFLLMVVLCFVMPAHAQSDGFFKDSGEYTDRDGSGYNLGNQTFGAGGYILTNQTFGENAPLGSGLLIMTIAGIGYAIRKRKE